MNGSRVSIIVPTFNRVKYLGECLSSLLAQTVPAFEILVVDDGSDDETAACVAAFGNRISYVRKENGGKPSAVNLGLSIVRGDLIWLFDDDDVALPDAIERRLEALEADQRAGFVLSPHFVGTDGPDGRIVRGALQPVSAYSVDDFFLRLMTNCFFHLGTALVRRQLYDEVGRFDEDLLSSEDYDMQIRLARVARPAYCSSATFVFRQHDGTRGSQLIRHAANQRSAVFQTYSRAIGRKLRAGLPMGEYVVPRATDCSDAARRRQALLNRVHVLANHGCLPEMFQDIRALLELATADSMLLTAEARSLSDSMCAGWAYEASSEDWQSFLASVRSLNSYPCGPVAIRALASGMFRLAKSYPGSASKRLVQLRRAAQMAFQASRNPLSRQVA